MDASIKIQILLVLLLVSVLLISMMLIGNALGNIGNILKRLDEMIRNEIKIRNDRQSSIIKRVSTRNKLDQIKRDRAGNLLNIPIEKIPDPPKEEEQN